MRHGRIALGAKDVTNGHSRVEALLASWPSTMDTEGDAEKMRAMVTLASDLERLSETAAQSDLAEAVSAYFSVLDSHGSMVDRVNAIDKMRNALKNDAPQVAGGASPGTVPTTAQSPAEAAPIKSSYQGKVDNSVDAQRCVVVAPWLPIETAPRDSEVLLWGKNGVMVDRWGYYCVNNVPKFTHWMPLPSGPERNGE
jgi:hypothetical protein